jgi:hypothetical protein
MKNEEGKGHNAVTAAIAAAAACAFHLPSFLSFLPIAAADDQSKEKKIVLLLLLLLLLLLSLSSY